MTPDGRYVVSAGDDKVVRIWDWLSRSTVRILRGQISGGPQGAIYALAISPDGKYVAVGGLLAGTDAAAQSVIRVHDL